MTPSASDDDRVEVFAGTRTPLGGPGSGLGILGRMLTPFLAVAVIVCKNHGRHARVRFGHRLPAPQAPLFRSKVNHAGRTTHPSDCGVVRTIENCCRVGWCVTSARIDLHYLSTCFRLPCSAFRRWVTFAWRSTTQPLALGHPGNEIFAR
jgi:hypothetical protein